MISGDLFPSRFEPSLGYQIERERERKTSAIKTKQKFFFSNYAPICSFKVNEKWSLMGTSLTHLFFSQKFSLSRKYSQKFSLSKIPPLSKILSKILSFKNSPSLPLSQKFSLSFSLDWKFWISIHFLPWCEWWLPWYANREVSYL